MGAPIIVLSTWLDALIVHVQNQFVTGATWTHVTLMAGILCRYGPEQDNYRYSTTWERMQFPTSSTEAFSQHTPSKNSTYPTSSSPHIPQDYTPTLSTTSAPSPQPSQASQIPQTTQSKYRDIHKTPSALLWRSVPRWQRLFVLS